MPSGAGDDGTGATGITACAAGTYKDTTGAGTLDLPLTVPPLFVLGGPKRDSEDEAVQYAADVVANGASGIAFGRNTWSAKDPAAMVRRLHAAVHGSA